jgi:cytochrome c oxidase cbb3-type subunit 2
MPAYPWLADRAANAGNDIVARMRALKTLGTPYTDEAIAAAPAALEGKTELDALIAYLQMLGRFASDEPEQHAGH